MIALLSNDDGYVAEGIIQLHKICLPLFDQVHVFAPDRDCSGRSSALTLRRPLYMHEHSNGFFSVEGNPSDCVHLALTGQLKDKVDMVISGINLGANLGDDTIYSGTVAAAIEGRFLDYPSLAISITNARPSHYETASWVITKVIKHLQKKPLSKEMILNINIPDIPLEDLKGIAITKLSKRGPANKGINQTIDHHGNDMYWIGAAGEMLDKSEGTDVHAIENGYASITPLQIDLTYHKKLALLKDWSLDI